MVRARGNSGSLFSTLLVVKDNIKEGAVHVQSTISSIIWRVALGRGDFFRSG
jgi:hypothetical protein